jgi:hypothetical protein
MMQYPRQVKKICGIRNIAKGILGEKTMADWKEEFKKCNDNKLCISEVDAKARGTWFFQMNFLGFKKVMLGSQSGTETVGGTFEVLEFAPTFKELDIYNEDEESQLIWRAAEIYTSLDLIKTGEAMAFVKMRDDLSVQLAEARQEKRPFNQFKFSLKKFSRNGGVLYKFDLEMQSVFILDIKPASAAEKVLITYSKTQFGANVPAESEEDELRRVMRGR